MKSFTKPWLSLTLVAALSVPVAGNAVTIIGNNLSGNGSGTTLEDNDAEAAGFTLGAASYILDNVILRLKNNGSSSGDDPLANLSIWSNNSSNKPGTNLKVLNQIISSNINNEISSTSASNYTFTPATQLILQAGIKYWLVLSDGRNISDDLVWLSNGTPSGSHATNNGYLISTNNGGTWSSSTTKNQYQINGTLVPAVSVPYSASLWQGLAVVLLGGYMMVSLNRKRVYQD